MAFMMPVVKKDWEIYPNKPVRSRKTSTCSNPRNKSQTDMLSISPKSQNEFIPPSVRAYHRSGSQDSGDSVPDVTPIPKSASNSSFSNFHTKLVEKIRKISRSKHNSEGESSTDASARSST